MGQLAEPMSGVRVSAAHKREMAGGVRLPRAGEGAAAR
jgi:hypothetical protein